MLKDTTRTAVRQDAFVITTLDDVDAARESILAGIGMTESELRVAGRPRSDAELQALRSLDELVWAARGV